MLTASMAPLHSLGQEDKNNVWHDFGDVTPLVTLLAPAFASHGATVNGTIQLIRLRSGSSWKTIYLVSVSKKTHKED